MGGSTADLCWREVKDKDLVKPPFELDIYKFGDGEVDDWDYDTMYSHPQWRRDW